MDLVIPMESNHPYSHKLASLRSIVHRLLTYNLSPDEFEKEEAIIKKIVLNNGYDTDMVDDLIRRKKRKKKCTNYRIHGMTLINYQTNASIPIT